MLNSFRPAIVLLGLFTVLTGILYPLAITGVAQAVMPGGANGSLVRDGDRVIGSTLIGQAFVDGRYFWPRPSAAGDGYDAGASSGSNLGTTSQTLKDRVQGDIQKLRDTGVEGDLPGDAITASGSGLDPHISPAFATAQIDRVAGARGLTPEQVAALVADHTQARLLGLIGEPRVNLLALNLALDRQFP